MPAPLENVLMRSHGLKYAEARKVVLAARERLGLPKHQRAWTDELLQECHKLVPSPAETSVPESRKENEGSSLVVTVNRSQPQGSHENPKKNEDDEVTEATTVTDDRTLIAQRGYAVSIAKRLASRTSSDSDSDDDSSTSSSSDDSSSSEEEDDAIEPIVTQQQTIVEKYVRPSGGNPFAQSHEDDEEEASESEEIVERAEQVISEKYVRPGGDNLFATSCESDEDEASFYEEVIEEDGEDASFYEEEVIEEVIDDQLEPPRQQIISEKFARPGGGNPFAVAEETDINDTEKEVLEYCEKYSSNESNDVPSIEEGVSVNDASIPTRSLRRERTSLFPEGKGTFKKPVTVGKLRKTSQTSIAEDDTTEAESEYGDDFVLKVVEVPVKRGVTKATSDISLKVTRQKKKSINGRSSSRVRASSRVKAFPQFRA